MSSGVVAHLEVGWVAAEDTGVVASRFPRPPGPVKPTPQGYRVRVTRPLRIADCRAMCAWQDTGELLDRERLFACSGCGSEWVPSQPWTPADYTGAVPAPVSEARGDDGGRRVRGRG
jgi:hypothetical protein